MAPDKAVLVQEIGSANLCSQHIDQFLQILLNLNSYELTLIYQCTFFYSRVYSILILIKSSAYASIMVVVV